MRSHVALLLIAAVAGGCRLQGIGVGGGASDAAAMDAAVAGVDFARVTDAALPRVDIAGFDAGACDTARFRFQGQPVVVGDFCDFGRFCAHDGATAAAAMQVDARVYCDFVGGGCVYQCVLNFSATITADDLARVCELLALEPATGMDCIILEG